MKHIKLFEQFLNENAAPKLKDLLNTEDLAVEIGSGTHGKTEWDKNELIEIIDAALTHNLFDADFYYNWTDNGKAYKSFFIKDVIKPLMKNIDKTLKEYFYLSQGIYRPILKFKMDWKEREDWIDNWFQTSGIPDNIKKDYYKYREEYAGVKLK